MIAPNLFPNCRARKPRYTRAFRFSPQCLIDLAQTDIGRKAANRKINAAGPSDYHRLGFLPGDVRHDDKPADVLRRALKRARRRGNVGPGHAKPYDDRAALRAALKLAEAQ